MEATTQEHADHCYDHKPVEEMTEAEREEWRNEVLRRTEETLKRSKEMLERSARDHEKYEAAARAGQQLDRKWKELQDGFHRVFSGFANKFAESLQVENPQFEKECKWKSKDATPQEAGEMLAQVIENLKADDKVIREEEEENEEEAKVSCAKAKARGKFIILTGAGLSAPSGLPTFRGEGGLWSDEKVERAAEYHDEQFDEMKQNPMEIIKQSTLVENPKLNWNWHLKFFKDIAKCKPNVAHEAVLKLQEFCKKQRIGNLLITQNVDGYHCDLLEKSKIMNIKKKGAEGDPDYAFTPQIVEIHGNFKFMRCNKDCPGFYRAPNHIAAFKTEHEIPKCKDCGGLMRHHCLFFDESYDDRYYQRQRAEQYMKEADAIIVIGTELETALPNRIVRTVKTRQKLVVEVNLKPKITGAGRILNVAGGCENTLPAMVDAFIKKVGVATKGGQPAKSSKAASAAAAAASSKTRGGVAKKAKK